MKTDFHTHFHILKSKLNKRGLAPMFVRPYCKWKKK